MIIDLTKRQYKTFKQWSILGFRINKGEKATWLNNEANFGLSQVTKMPEQRAFYEGLDDQDCDDYGMYPDHMLFGDQ